MKHKEFRDEEMIDKSKWNITVAAIEVEAVDDDG